MRLQQRLDDRLLLLVVIQPIGARIPPQPQEAPRVLRNRASVEPHVHVAETEPAVPAASIVRQKECRVLALVFEAGAAV